MLNWIVAKIQQLTWPISRKLLFSFGLILLLFILNGATVFAVQLRISTLDNEEAQKSQIVQQIQDVRRLLKAQADLFADALFINDKHTLSDNYGGEISNQLRQLREQKERLGASGAQLLDSFSADYRKILTNFGQIAQLISRGDPEQARREWPIYAELFKNASNHLEDLFNDQLNNYNALSKEKSNLIQFSLGVTVVSTLLCILVGSFLALLFRRCIGQPIKQIQHYVDEVAVGNLSGAVRVENRDELGRLAQVLNLAVSNLRRVIGGSQVGDHLKELAETLNNSSHQQANGSTEQLGSTTQLIATMQELAQRSQQISHNAANVAQATEQTSQRMRNLQLVARQAESMVAELQQAVIQTVTNMEEVNLTVATLAEELNQLTGQTQQIGKVIELISGVSDEVHLLAFNAAIEAVGAGQHGERFGVVAGEVKSLATRTKQNAGQIALLVKQVQQSSLGAQQRALQTSKIAQNVVHTNEKLKMVVVGINETVTQSVAVATETFNAARAVDTQVEAIKYATQEQMNASLQASEALQRIGRMAEENVAASRYIAASTSQLDNISSKLVDILASVSLS